MARNDARRACRNRVRPSVRKSEDSTGASLQAVLASRTAWATEVACALLILSVAAPAHGTTLEPHTVVHGGEVSVVSVRSAGGSWSATAWADLDRTALDPGRYEVRLQVSGDEGGSLALPHCAGRERVAIDGHDVASRPGPLVVPLARGRREVVMTVSVTAYERRIACGDSPRLGESLRSTEGLGILAFESPWKTKGGGAAVVYVPPLHDIRAPSAVLVGLHPWNGSIWSYAAYAQLLSEARRRDLVLVMPSGLGNSLYTADAEDEVMRAIAALADVIAVDGAAVSLWGASMGGAGATTIGFHHPDRFASITSFFGDSKYDLTTYVRSILPSEAAAHQVNALDVVDNARALPLWLIHGDRDRTSPIQQSEMLAKAMANRGFPVRFDRVPAAGHSGALVARFLPELVAVAASARVPQHVERVTYRSVRPADTGAYGVRLARTTTTGDAFVDIEHQHGEVHVLRAEGVRALVLTRGALGTSPDHPYSADPVVIDDPLATGVDVRWEP
jgi:pimeloyl-ACP methyl ester carboxylesterase